MAWKLGGRIAQCCLVSSRLLGVVSGPHESLRLQRQPLTTPVQVFALDSISVLKVVLSQSSTSHITSKVQGVKATVLLEAATKHAFVLILLTQHNHTPMARPRPNHLCAPLAAEPICIQTTTGWARLHAPPHLRIRRLLHHQPPFTFALALPASWTAALKVGRWLAGGQGSYEEWSEWIALPPTITRESGTAAKT